MIDYSEDWSFSLLFHMSGSVAVRSAYFAFPAMIIAVCVSHLDAAFLDWRKEAGISILETAPAWNASTACLIFLMGFRTKKAIDRFWEGTGLLHQMRGEWFDTVSNCVTFSVSAKRRKAEDVMIFRHALVRMMSLAHGNALEEISGNQFQLVTIDVHGLDMDTLKHLRTCEEVYSFNKVEVLLHMIQSLIINAYDEGLLEVPAPILSRVYQTISRGFVHLLNTKKITDTKFPLPYAQLIAILLLFNTVWTPIMLSDVAEGALSVGIITFVYVFGLSCLNNISIELENPFGKDDNDLPLDHFQAEMDSCLLMLLNPKADLITSVSPECIMDFEALKDSLGLCSGGRAGRYSQVSLKEYMLGRRCGNSVHSGDVDLERRAGDSTDDIAEHADAPDADDGNIELLEVAGMWSKIPTTGTAPPAGLALCTHGMGDKVVDKPSPSDQAHAPRGFGPLPQNSLEDFTRSLDNWTKVIEASVLEINANFQSLLNPREAISTTGDRLRYSPRA